MIALLLMALGTVIVVVALWTWAFGSLEPACDVQAAEPMTDTNPEIQAYNGRLTAPPRMPPTEQDRARAEIVRWLAREFGSDESAKLTFTPERAAAILEHLNEHNFRVLKPSKIKRMAADVQRAGWDVNGETIVFGPRPDWRLVDGQHRLALVVHLNQTLQSFAVCGVTKTGHIDTGWSRSDTERASARGWAYTTLMPGTIRTILASERMTSQKQFPVVYSDEMFEYGDANQGALEAALTKTATARKLVSQKIAAAAYYRFARIDAALADFMVDVLDERVAAPIDHPFSLLRRHLTEERIKRRKAVSEDVLLWFIRAWNAARAGKSVTPRTALFRNRRMDAKSEELVAMSQPA